MRNAFLGLGQIAFGLFLGIQCALFLVILCLKIYKRASFSVKQSPSDSSAPIMSSNPPETVQIRVEGERPNEEERERNETAVKEEENERHGSQSNDSRFSDTGENVRTEQTYEEIDIEIQPYGTYSTIQEVAKGNEAMTKVINSDYSTIETVLQQQQQEVACFTEVHSSLEQLTKTSFRSEENGGNEETRHSPKVEQAINADDVEKISQLYSKVIKRHKDGSRPNEINTNCKSPFAGDDVRKDKFDSGADVPIVVQRPVEVLYSEVSKKRKTIALAENVRPKEKEPAGVIKKFASGNVYFGICCDHNGGSTENAGKKEKKEEKQKEECQPHEEIVIKTDELHRISHIV